MKIKSLRTLATALGAVCFLTLAAFAGDPTGNWKSTMARPDGSPGRSGKLTLALKDGALTGTISGRGGEIAIGDGSFKDDAIAFTVTRTMNDNTFTTKFSGKLAGDTITGSVELPPRDGGEPMKLDWTATRVKEGEAAPAPAAPAPAPAPAAP